MHVWFSRLSSARMARASQTAGETYSAGGRNAEWTSYACWRNGKFEIVSPRRFPRFHRQKKCIITAAGKPGDGLSPQRMRTKG